MQHWQRQHVEAASVKEWCMYRSNVCPSDAPTDYCINRIPPRHSIVETSVCYCFRTGIGEGMLVTIIVRAIERKIMLNRYLPAQSLDYWSKLIFVDKHPGLGAQGASLRR